jgi:hypothetical protein
MCSGRTGCRRSVIRPKTPQARFMKKTNGNDEDYYYHRQLNPAPTQSSLWLSFSLPSQAQTNHDIALVSAL